MHQRVIMSHTPGPSAPMNQEQLNSLQLQGHLQPVHSPLPRDEVYQEGKGNTDLGQYYIVLFNLSTFSLTWRFTVT